MQRRPLLPPRALGLALALLTAALLAPSAHASVVTTPGFPPALNVTAGASEENRGSINCQYSFGGPSTCVVIDFSGVTESSDICAPNSSTQVTCTGDPFTGSPVIDLGDFDDFLNVTSDNVVSFDITLGAGDDTLLGPDGGLGDVIRGNRGNDWIEGQHGSDEIHAGAGRDTVIGGAGFNVIYGEDGNDNLMSGPWLGTESALNGGDGDDQLTGGWAFDTLAGGRGDDRLDGDRHGDELDGGPDFDTVDYGDRADGVTVTIDGQPNDGNALDDGFGDDMDDVRPTVEAVLGGEGGDFLVGALGQPVTFVGNAGIDTIIGSDQVDVLRGGPGGDSFDGRLGGDTIDGDAGTDRMLYTPRSGPVAVSLDDVRNDGADPDQDGVSTGAEEGDLVRGVEDAWTGAGADILVGSNGVNVLRGGNGDDLLDGLLGGDTLDGQVGVDTVDYRSRTAAVAVRLDNLRNDGADPNGDRTSGAGEERDLIRDVENAFGGTADDFLWGNAVRNFLLSGAGNDSIRSRDGTAVQDVVNCGQGASDVVDADPADNAMNCEGTGTLP
jgi:Ca2+-binding RTX toxin-like protein